MADKQLIEFGAGEDRVVVEIEDRRLGPRPASRGLVEKVNQSFKQVAGGIRPIAWALLDEIKDLAPAEAEIEFGVKFTAEAGVVLASTGGEVHCTVKLVWKKEG